MMSIHVSLTEGTEQREACTWLIKPRTGLRHLPSRLKPVPHPLKTLLSPMKLWSTLDSEELVILGNTCIFQYFVFLNNSTWSPQFCSVSTVADTTSIFTP